jgi:hypothetical protein
LSAAVEVQNNSFKELLSPSSVVSGRRFVLECKLDIGRVESKMRLCVLPFKTLRNLVTSDSNQTALDSDSLSSKDKISEFFFRSDETETDLSFRETEKKSAEQSENLEISKQEDKEITSFAEANAFRRANQVAMSIPPASLPPGSVGTIGTSRPFSNFLAVGLLALGGVVGFFTLVYKFKNRNND